MAVVYGNNNCQQTAHPTRAPPPTTDSSRYRYTGTAHESTVQYSGRMFRSPAVGTLTVTDCGEEGVQKSSQYFRHDSYPGGRKKCCNDDESDVLVWRWQQLSECTPDTHTHPHSRSIMTVIGRPVVGTPWGRGPAESVFCA